MDTAASPHYAKGQGRAKFIFPSPIGVSVSFVAMATWPLSLYGSVPEFRGYCGMCGFPSCPNCMNPSGSGVCKECSGLGARCCPADQASCDRALRARQADDERERNAMEEEFQRRQAAGVAGAASSSSSSGGAPAAG